MDILKFWPTEADCLECIKPEAENPSDAVFLAIHQEMRFVRTSFQTNQAVKRSERQLLNEFLRDEPSGRVILPILGESGIGKSHVVRWLDLQLRRRDDREARHIIRIPKSSSLKSVLGTILDGLEGPRYEEIRVQLRAAREQMDDTSAKNRIRAELLIAIERRYNAAAKRKATGKETGEILSVQDKLWNGHGDARCLPALLTDPATVVLFMRGTQKRPGIINELARHLTKDTSESESPRRQFEKADFIIPEELSDDIKEAGNIAGRYLQKFQRDSSTSLIDEVVGLLNGIVDDAIAPLATPADTSLSELFYEVRRQLLADGRELVLLVEDFAVLAGVQKALLDAIIREGETGGKTEACMIRTALAVTDGYFGNLETVQTRAIYGWRIESREDAEEEEVTNQIGNFVAAYVNAARIGAKRLEKHYENATNVGKKAPNAIEVLAMEEDEIALLENFGRSADDYSLFPFNQLAIRTIADWQLRDPRHRLKFHPRNIINEIILPVVKDARINFERGEFPPENFLGYPKTQISADLSDEVSRKESDAWRRNQYLYLFQFWAEQPEKLAEVELPEGVFTAFGLSTLDGTTKVDAPKRLKPISGEGTGTGGVGPTPGTGTTGPVAGKEPLAIQQFVEKINKWRGGTVLGQSESNRIRGWMNIHILHSINWEAELLRPIKPTTNTYATNIYLPTAKGNPPKIDKAFVIVAGDEQFKDDAVANDIFAAIRAMLRYDHHKGWDYKQADDDYVALANFIDRHLVQAANWIHARYKSLDGSPVPALTQTLLWQARQLNVETAHRSDDVGQIDAIFAPAPERGERDDHQEWNDFLDEMASKRQLLLDELLERITAFQGVGKTPHAVDASQILGSIQDFRKTWEISEKFPQPPTSPIDELKQIEKHVKLLSNSGLQKIDERRKRIADQSKLIVAELGKDYDKTELLKDLEKVCSLAEQHGLTGDTSVGGVRKIAETFKEARAKEAGEQVEAIVTGDDLGTRMSAIAKLDIQTHALLVKFAETCSTFLKERAGKAENKILQWTEEVVRIEKARVDEVLQKLEEGVKPYGKSDT